MVNSSIESPVSANNGPKTHARELGSSCDSRPSEDGSSSCHAQIQESSNKTHRKIPHYLRASTGSCHDLCKYGRRNHFEEEKPWKNPQRRAAKSPRNKLDSVEIMVSDMRKKEKVVKNEGSSDASKLRTLLEAKSGKGTNALSGKKARSVHGISAMEKSHSMDPPEIIKKEITAEKTYDQDRFLEISSNSVESKCDVEGSSSSLADNSGRMIIKGSRNHDLKTGRAMKALRANGKEASATTLSKKAGKLNKRNTEVSGNNISESITEDRNGIAPLESSISRDEKTKQKQDKTRQTSRKLVVSEGKQHRSSVKSKFTSGNIVDPEKLQSRSSSTINDKGNESTNITKKRTIKESPPPVKLRFRSGKVLNLPQENITPRRLKFRTVKPVNHHEADKLISDRNESNVQPVKGNDIKPQRKKKVVDSEEKPPSPVKVYRSRKVVDPPSDTGLVKRLRFRKVRVSRIEGDKGESRIKTFRTNAGKDDATGTEISRKKFTFKHRNVQAKKDTQVSFNNVIEETASKLVESRKSKVKALVGAFETVISLQERKPSSRTAT